MKDILIITNYYPPETGAASNRIYELASGLKKHGFKISVVTPLPNYPAGKIFKAYKGHFKSTRKEENITIHRLWIYASNSKNKLLRLFAMLSYSFSLIWFFLWHKIPHTVIIHSPPLLVAFTSIFCLRSKKRRLILNVSDLWPKAGLELGAFKNNYSYRLLEKIEHFNYRYPSLILGQSEEIVSHILNLYPTKKTFLYRNYPNFEPARLNNNQIIKGKIKLVYAGLLGVAQGIYKLCKELDYTHVEFHIYGTGSEKNEIENLSLSHPELDIVYHGEIPRAQLHQELLQYDLTIIPLLKRIYGSVPSKIFEYARLGLPLLYFGGGEGEHIVKDNILGWIAKPGDYNDLNRVIATIDKTQLDNTLKKSIQKKAIETFDFEQQLEKLVKLL